MALDIGKGDRTSWASRIRGEERIALVDDLARGDRTHAQLAEEYGRSPDAIHQFASRNSAEIARRRAVLQGELGAETAEKWIRDKAQLVDYIGGLSGRRVREIVEGLHLLTEPWELE